MPNELTTEQILDSWRRILGDTTGQTAALFDEYLRRSQGSNLQDAYGAFRQLMNSRGYSDADLPSLTQRSSAPAVPAASGGSIYEAMRIDPGRGQPAATGGQPGAAGGYYQLSEEETSALEVFGKSVANELTLGLAGHSTPQELEDHWIASGLGHLVGILPSFFGAGMAVKLGAKVALRAIAQRALGKAGGNVAKVAAMEASAIARALKSPVTTQVATWTLQGRGTEAARRALGTSEEAPGLGSFVKGGAWEAMTGALLGGAESLVAKLPAGKALKEARVDYDKLDRLGSLFGDKIARTNFGRIVKDRKLADVDLQRLLRKTSFQAALGESAAFVTAGIIQRSVELGTPFPEGWEKNLFFELGIPIAIKGKESLRANYRMHKAKVGVKNSEPMPRGEMLKFITENAAEIQEAILKNENGIRDRINQRVADVTNMLSTQVSRLGNNKPHYEAETLQRVRDEMERFITEKKPVPARPNQQIELTDLGGKPLPREPKPPTDMANEKAVAKYEEKMAVFRKQMLEYLTANNEGLLGELFNVRTMLASKLTTQQHSAILNQRAERIIKRLADNYQWERDNAGKISKDPLDGIDPVTLADAITGAMLTDEARIIDRGDIRRGTLVYVRKGGRSSAGGDKTPYGWAIIDGDIFTANSKGKPVDRVPVRWLSPSEGGSERGNAKLERLFHRDRAGVTLESDVMERYEAWRSENMPDEPVETRTPEPAPSPDSASGHNLPQYFVDRETGTLYVSLLANRRTYELLGDSRPYQEPTPGQRYLFEVTPEGNSHRLTAVTMEDMADLQLEGSLENITDAQFVEMRKGAARPAESKPPAERTVPSGEGHKEFIADMAMALKGRSPEEVAAATSKLPPDIAQEISEELSYLGPVSEAEVSAARERLGLTTPAPAKPSAEGATIQQIAALEGINLEGVSFPESTPGTTVTSKSKRPAPPAKKKGESPVAEEAPPPESTAKPEDVAAEEQPGEGAQLAQALNQAMGIFPSGPQIGEVVTRTYPSNTRAPSYYGKAEGNVQTYQRANTHTPDTFRTEFEEGDVAYFPYYNRKLKRFEVLRGTVVYPKDQDPVVIVDGSTKRQRMFWYDSMPFEKTAEFAEQVRANLQKELDGRIQKLKKEAAKPADAPAAKPAEAAAPPESKPALRLSDVTERLRTDKSLNAEDRKRLWTFVNDFLVTLFGEKKPEMRHASVVEHIYGSRKEAEAAIRQLAEMEGVGSRNYRVVTLSSVEGGVGAVVLRNARGSTTIKNPITGQTYPVLPGKIRNLSDVLGKVFVHFTTIHAKMRLDEGDSVDGSKHPYNGWTVDAGGTFGRGLYLSLDDAFWSNNKGPSQIRALSEPITGNVDVDRGSIYYNYAKRGWYYYPDDPKFGPVAEGGPTAYSPDKSPIATLWRIKSDAKMLLLNSEKAIKDFLAEAGIDENRIEQTLSKVIGLRAREMGYDGIIWAGPSEWADANAPGLRGELSLTLTADQIVMLNTGAIEKIETPAMDRRINELYLWMTNQSVAPRNPKDSYDTQMARFSGNDITAIVAALKAYGGRNAAFYESFVFKVEDDLPREGVREVDPLTLTESGRIVVDLRNHTNVAGVIREFGRLASILAPEDTFQEVLFRHYARDGRWTADSENRLLEDWEKFHAHGEAPNVEMRGLFQRMAKWVRDFWENFTGVPNGSMDRLPREVVNYFDRFYKGDVTRRMNRVEVDRRINAFKKRAEWVPPEAGTSALDQWHGLRRTLLVLGSRRFKIKDGAIENLVDENGVTLNNALTIDVERFPGAAKEHPEMPSIVWQTKVDGKTVNYLMVRGSSLDEVLFFDPTILLNKQSDAVFTAREMEDAVRRYSEMVDKWIEATNARWPNLSDNSPIRQFMLDAYWAGKRRWGVGMGGLEQLANTVNDLRARYGARLTTEHEAEILNHIFSRDVDQWIQPTDIELFKKAVEDMMSRRRTNLNLSGSTDPIEKTKNKPNDTKLFSSLGFFDMESLGELGKNVAKAGRFSMDQLKRGWTPIAKYLQEGSMRAWRPYNQGEYWNDKYVMPMLGRTREGMDKLEKEMSEKVWRYVESKRDIERVPDDEVDALEKDLRKTYKEMTEGERRQADTYFGMLRRERELARAADKFYDIADNIIETEVLTRMKMSEPWELLENAMSGLSRDEIKWMLDKPSSLRAEFSEAERAFIERNPELMEQFGVTGDIASLSDVSHGRVLLLIEHPELRPPTEGLQRFIDAVSEIMGSYDRQFKSADISQLVQHVNPETGEVTWTKQAYQGRKYYFAHILTEEAQEALKLQDEGNPIFRALSEYGKRANVDIHTIANSIASSKILRRKFGNVEYQRTADLPPFVRGADGKIHQILETNPHKILTYYIARASRTLALADVWMSGTVFPLGGGKVGQAFNLFNEYGKIIKDTGLQRYYDLYVDLANMTQGLPIEKVNYRSRVWRITQGLSNIGRMAGLSASAIGNLPTYAIIAQRWGTANTLKAMREVFSDVETLEELRQIGTWTRDIMSFAYATADISEYTTTGRVARAGMRIVGANAVNLHLTKVSQLAALHSADKAVELIRSGNETAIERFFGVSASALRDKLQREMKWSDSSMDRILEHGLTERDRARVAIRGSALTNVVGESVLDRPVWLNKHIWRMLYAYTGFARNVNAGVIDAFKRVDSQGSRAWGAFVSSLLFAVGGGMWYTDQKDFIKDRATIVDMIADWHRLAPVEQRRAMQDRITQYVFNSGVLGFATNIFQGLYYLNPDSTWGQWYDESISNFFTPPPLQMYGDLIFRGLFPSLRYGELYDWWQSDAWRQVKRTTPMVSLIADGYARVKNPKLAAARTLVQKRMVYIHDGIDRFGYHRAGELVKDARLLTAKGLARETNAYYLTVAIEEARARRRRRMSINANQRLEEQQENFAQ